jgi:archaellum component FlaG (FlaF/FlaG flagellin family)
MKVCFRRWVPALLAMLFVTGILSGCKKQETEEAGNTGSGFRVEYAADSVGVVEDPDEFQKAINEAAENAEKSAIALEYKNDAFSDDGVNFACYIANSLSNRYDMFIAIYGNAELTDELFLSKLIRPGQTFEQVTLNRALEKGEHQVFVVFTQVDEVDGEQTICGQRAVTMNFFVE